MSICGLGPANTARVRQRVVVATPRATKANERGSEEQAHAVITVEILKAPTKDDQTCFCRAVLVAGERSSAELYFEANAATGRIERVYGSDHKPSATTPPRHATADDLLLRSVAATQAGSVAASGEYTPDGWRKITVHKDETADGVTTRSRTILVNSTLASDVKASGNVVFDAVTGRIAYAHVSGDATLELPSGDVISASAELQVTFGSSNDAAASATAIARKAFDPPLTVASVAKRFGAGLSVAQFGARIKADIIAHAPLRASALPLVAPPAPAPPRSGFRSVADELWAAAAIMDATSTPGAADAAALAQAVNAAADDWAEEEDKLRSASNRLARADSAMSSPVSRAGQAALLASLTASRDQDSDDALLMHLLESGEPTGASTPDARARAEIARTASAAAIAAHPAPSARLLASLIEFHRQRLMEEGVCKECPPNDASMMFAYAAVLCRAAEHAGAMPTSPETAALGLARDEGMLQLAKWATTASRSAIKAMDKGAPASTYDTLSASVLSAFASAASHPAMASARDAAGDEMRVAAKAAAALAGHRGVTPELKRAAITAETAAAPHASEHAAIALKARAAASAESAARGAVSAQHRAGFAAASAASDRAGAVHVGTAALAGGRCTKDSFTHQLSAAWTMQALSRRRSSDYFPADNEAISLTLGAAGVGVAELRTWGVAVEAGVLPSACSSKSATPGHVAVAPGPRRAGALPLVAALPATAIVSHYALYQSNITWHGVGCDNRGDVALEGDSWHAAAVLVDIDAAVGDGAHLVTVRARSANAARTSVLSRAHIAQAGVCATEAQAEATAGEPSIHVSVSTATLERSCGDGPRGVCSWRLPHGAAERSVVLRNAVAESGTKVRHTDSKKVVEGEL